MLYVLSRNSPKEDNFLNIRDMVVDTDCLISVAELAAFEEMSVSGIYKRIRQGRVKAVKIGKMTFVISGEPIDRAKRPIKRAE